jgi:hypothetical protein
MPGRGLAVAAVAVVAFFVGTGPAAAAGVTAYFNNLAGFNAAAGSPPVQVTFDGIAPGTNITGTTHAGVTFDLGNSPPPSAQLIVVRGADTFTTAGFVGAASPATNKLFPTSGANVLSPGGVELRPGPNPPFENDDLELRFATPVAAFGFDLLYQSLDCCSFVGITIRDSAGVVIYANPFIPSGGFGAGGPGGAEFVGFVSDSANIARIVIDEFDGDPNFPDANIGFDTFRFGVAAPATLTLAPETDTNPVGSPHTVTATVRDASNNPTPGVTVRFSVTGANSASGSSTTDANGQASFTYTGTVAGDDTISAFADTDDDRTQDSGEPGDTAAKTWTAGPPATLTLSPETATNPVDSEHCVTATVEDAFGNPVPGVTVRFTVAGSDSASGSATTDANGQATFCYTVSALPGADAIHAFADTDGDATQDVGEPFDDATKLIVLPPSTPGCTVSNGGRIMAANGDRATFGGSATFDGLAASGDEHYRDHGPAANINVDSTAVLAVVCSPDKTQATIFGQATINGSSSHLYRIGVKDLNEPGRNDTYRILLSTGYDSGEQTLIGGNVQIQ